MSIEAERAALGAMLYSREQCEVARSLLEPRHFFSAAHARIFSSLLHIAARGEDPDLTLLRHELKLRDDLEAVGGDEYLATLSLSSSHTNLPAYAAIIRETVQRRAALHLGLELQADAPAAELVAKLEQGLETLRAYAAQPTGRFRDAARAAADFVKLEIPRPPSLLGESLLVAGGFAILYGSPGLGKSWLALELGISIARGAPWLGIPTPSEGASVGVVQLELGEHSLQERLKTLGVGSQPRDAGLKIVCRPALKGVVDLYRRPQDSADLRDWIQHERLSVLVLDAFSRTHTASENTAEEIGAVLGSLDALRHETGCAIVLVHHVRKESKDSNPDNHSDEMRGHSRLQSDPTLLMRVVRGHGLKRLVFAKVSEGITPDDICFHIREDGKPEVVESPEATADKNKDTIARIISEASAPLAVSEIESKSGMARRTVQRHLKTLTSEGVVEVSGEKKHARYAPCATMRQNDEWREVSPSASKALDERWQ
jgi:DNA-binding transcriptional ArsR family regulator